MNTNSTPKGAPSLLTTSQDGQIYSVVTTGYANGPIVPGTTFTRPAINP